MFGLSASVIDCGASQFLPYAYINAYYSTPTIPHDETTMRKYDPNCLILLRNNLDGR